MKNYSCKKLIDTNGQPSISQQHHCWSENGRWPTVILYSGQCMIMQSNQTSNNFGFKICQKVLNTYTR